MEEQTEAEAQAAAPIPDAATMAQALRIAEALIFAADRPVSPQTLATVLPEGVSATMACAALAQAYQGRGVELTEIGGGYAFRTATDLAPRLTKVVESPRRLPRAAMETLAIIAYHQPCTRGDVEEIRGATLAQTTLEALLELGLVAPRGRREVPGRPTLWGTTPKFLEQFSLKSLGDLPRKEELVTGDAPLLSGLNAPISTAEEAEAHTPEAESPPEAAEETSQR
jgi:segregation and condensation protein B